MSNLMKLEEQRGTDENKSRGVKTEDMTEIIRSSVDPTAETKATRRKSTLVKRQEAKIGAVLWKSTMRWRIQGAGRYNRYASDPIFFSISCSFQEKGPK